MKWEDESCQASSGFIRQEIRDLIARGNVTPDEWKALRMNSYEREALVPALGDEALCHHVESCLAQCGRTRSPPSTYETAVVGLLAPELVRRLRAHQERWAKALPWLPGPDFKATQANTSPVFNVATFEAVSMVVAGQPWVQLRFEHTGDGSPLVVQMPEQVIPSASATEYIRSVADRGRRRIFADYIWRMRLWASEVWHNDPHELKKAAYLSAAKEAERVASDCWIGFDVEKDRR